MDTLELLRILIPPATLLGAWAVLYSTVWVVAATIRETWRLVRKGQEERAIRDPEKP